MRRFIILLATFTMALTACAGAAPDPAVAANIPSGHVWTAQTGTTLYWLNQAFQGASQTTILAKDGGYIVLWNMPGSSGMGFTLIKEAGRSITAPVIDWVEATGGKGNIAGYTDAGAFVRYMKDNGWKAVGANQVAQSVRTGVQAAWEAYKASGAAALEGFTSFSSGLVSFFVMPVGAVPQCPINECGYGEYY